MAVGRPDGLPLCEDYLDYNYNEKMPFTGDNTNTPMALSSFQHADRDIALDPLSTNRRIHTDIAVFGTVIVAGPSPESIQIIVPDCLVPPVDNVAQIDLRHVVELRLGSLFDMGSDLPPPDLALHLTPHSLDQTLQLQCRAYLDEINPLLERWRNVNDARCPECAHLIHVNMSRHMHLTHTTHVCYWRCPVPSCPLWFTSELNGKDHIENIHHFREGRRYSFYECLRKFGLEWFSSRQFFAEKTTTGQALWTHMALARRSGQGLHNSYTITGSPDFSPLRRFFIAAVAALQSRYDAMTPRECMLPMSQTCSLIDSMHEDIRQNSSAPDAYQSQVRDLPADEPAVDLPAASPVTQVRPLTPANRSLRFLETGAPGSPCVPVLSSHAAVPGTCLASTDLLSFIDPLPMDRLVLHDHRAGVRAVLEDVLH